MDLLETTICDPGTHFTIGDAIKDGTFGPGSSGFMAMTLGPECTCPNVMFYKAVITRRGKRGKERFEQAMLLAPIFKLPGVPNDFLIPESDGRKYFVDLSVKPTPTTLRFEFNNNNGELDFDDADMSINGYIGCLRSKTMFLRELDKVTKLAKHPLADKIGSAGAMQSIWPNKHSPLYKFDRNVESLYSGGDISRIIDDFFTSPNKDILFKDIRRAEAMLMIPRMEYHRKVEEAAMAALKYILDKLKSAEGKKLKNVGELVATTEKTIAAVKSKQDFLGKVIDSRMNCIHKNRKKLSLGVDDLF